MVFCRSWKVFPLEPPLLDPGTNLQGGTGVFGKEASDPGTRQHTHLTAVSRSVGDSQPEGSHTKATNWFSLKISEPLENTTCFWASGRFPVSFLVINGLDAERNHGSALGTLMGSITVDSNFNNSV